MSKKASQPDLFAVPPQDPEIESRERARRLTELSIKIKFAPGGHYHKQKKEEI